MKIKTKKKGVGHIQECFSKYICSNNNAINSLEARHILWLHIYMHSNISFIRVFLRTITCLYLIYLLLFEYTSMKFNPYCRTIDVFF